MRVYVDTSAMIALYQDDPKTRQVEAFCVGQKILISRLTLVEFRSAIFRAMRRGRITLEQARVVVDAFRRDLAKYVLREISPAVFRRAHGLIENHGRTRNLRSLDAIQLAVALELPGGLSVEHFVTLDTQPLADIAKAEGFSVKP